MDYQLRQQCRQTIYIATQAGIDYQTGEEVMGFASTYAARIMEKTQKVMTKNGIEVVSNSQIIMFSSMSINCDFVVWVPGEDHTNWDQAHTPLAVKNAVDENGNYDYTKIFLG
ncbi:MAG: hypothetical protein PHC43_01130 [Candidatus Marinimicrobia bacterium]|jgi:hypothetical protein|nr:hypothetical protein [Candidatus Neomarinimicrobiota bacterium]